MLELISAYQGNKYTIKYHLNIKDTDILLIRVIKDYMYS